MTYERHGEPTIPESWLRARGIEYVRHTEDIRDCNGCVGDEEQRLQEGGGRFRIRPQLQPIPWPSKVVVVGCVALWLLEVAHLVLSYFAGVAP